MSFLEKCTFILRKNTKLCTKKKLAEKNIIILVDSLNAYNALYNELQTSYIPRNMLLKRCFNKVSLSKR